MSDKPSIPTWQRAIDATLRAKAAEELRLLRAERLAASQKPADADGASARFGGAA